jgi:nucleotide-binding universal stress UspA family protein
MSAAPSLIISYDGTPNDEDALALGKMLAPAGFTLALAYVRHSHEFDARREEIAQHDAEQRLERGADLLGDPDVRRHIVVSASTGEGLGALAEEESASLIVFGSDYRTAPGHVEPGTSAQHLLDGGSVPVGIACAGLRTQLGGEIRSIAVPLAGPRNEVARQAAHALAAELGATLVESSATPVDLLVVGSQPSAPAGHIVVGGDVRSELGRARSSVLVLPADSSPLLRAGVSPSRDA